MSPTPPTLNPSQAVERIREIIVGRHLERLEHRVSRLEQNPTLPDTSSSAVEDRLLAAEAKLEALRENLQRAGDSAREEQQWRLSAHREETQRLAAQIQEIAATRASAQPDIQPLEKKLGGLLAQWQNTVHQQFIERDQRIVAQLRGELATLWESSENQITRVQSRVMDRDQIEDRFRRIAAAAQALAESAMPPEPASRNY
jgi:chromosome segregation ATPase